MPTRPLAGSTFPFEIELVDQTNTKLFKTSPTLAAGDIQRSINAAAYTNVDNLPTVTPAGSTQVQIVLSAAETTAAAAGGRIKVRWKDVAGAEWCDGAIEWFVYATENDQLATAASVAALPTASAIATAVWANATRTLSSFGTLTTDTAAAVWANATRTLTGFGTLVADIWAYVTRTLTSASSGITASDVWAYAQRTLTTMAMQVPPTVSGGSLSAIAAVSFSATLSGVTMPSGWQHLYFTVKADSQLANVDGLARLQIRLTNGGAAGDGLIALNGAVATNPLGASLVVDTPGAAVRIAISDETTWQLPAMIFAYDLKAVLTTGESVLLTAAKFAVTRTPTATTI